MRVIAGKAKRLQLKTPKGMDTRPTTDRIKETLFNMIQDKIYDVRFLDLFSGSGGIGIEALSRGAGYACFVEQNKEAAAVIRENLSFTRLARQAEVLVMNAGLAVSRLRGEEEFQIAFMDPPYGKELELAILQNPDFYEILSMHALIIVEADLQTHLPEDLDGFKVLREKIYKTNKHIFLEKVSKENK